MSLNIVTSQFFLPLGSVRLGSFITNIDHPHQGHHDPLYAQTPTPAISPLESFVGVNNTSSNASFRSSLMSFMSAKFSKRAKAHIKVTADKVQTYTLDNSDERFTEAMSMLPTQTWVERALDRGDDIYMIVGIHTITNARIAHQVVHGRETDGYMNCPVNLTTAAVHAAVPLAGIVAASLEGSSCSADKSQVSFLAPGEQACAFQYRKLQHRWFSSNGTEALRLSKWPQWSSIERGRDEEDGEDDSIQAELIMLVEDAFDGQWERLRTPAGEILLIRGEE